MPHSVTPPPLILASTSRYRQALLARWCVPFECVSPLVDETPLPQEKPLALATRLALAKARAVAAKYPNAFVIGSDQVLNLHGDSLGKPHTHDNAVDMLRRMRGNTMQFHTAVAVVQGGVARQGVDTVSVKIKPLTDAQIETYLRIDTPYDCAGSCKSESLGITLCERIESTDPTSQIGLPLILTEQLLASLGYTVLDYANDAFRGQP